MMDAIILCGGQGTRLRSAWDGAKCLAPVGGRPFIGKLLDQLIAGGFERAVLCIGHKSGEVRAALGCKWESLKIEYSFEATPLGTGGAIHHAAKKVSGPALVMNGDSYLHHPLNKVVHSYRVLENPHAMLVATLVPNRYEMHHVDWNKDDVVLNEYRLMEDKKPGWVSTGIYVINPRKFACTAPISLEDKIIPTWVSNGQMAGIKVRATMIDIGTPESYAQAESFFNNLKDG